jgi:hypothetical protein
MISLQIVDEAFKIAPSFDCIDMIFEQGNPAGIKQVFDSLDSGTKTRHQDNFGHEHKP